MADEARNDLLVPLTDLRRKLHQRRPVTIATRLAGLTVSDTSVDPASAVVVDVSLEAVSDGVTATGSVSARWIGPCNLCLDEVFGDVLAEVQEVFSDATADDDVYPIGREDVDLFPMVSDALLLELPLLAKCPNGGVGVCDRAPDLAEDKEGEEVVAESEAGLADPRWAALDALTFDEDK